MSLFRRNTTTLDELLARLKNPTSAPPGALDDLLDQVIGHPDATPRKLAFMLAADHPKVREAGFRCLAAGAARECAEIMVEAIAAAPVHRRREMAQYLGRLDRTVVVDALRRAFNAPGAKVEQRTAVLEIVGYGGSVLDMLPTLKAAAQPEQPQVLRRLAVRQLRRAAGAPGVAMLWRELVHDEDEQVRADALAVLCERPTADLVETLFARLPQERREVQQAIVGALSRLARECSEQMEEPLFGVLADECADTRAAAARLFAELPDAPAVLRRFLEFSRGLAQWLRERALDALTGIAEHLTDALADLMFDPAPDVRMTAMLLAARWNHAGLLPHVLRVWRADGDWWTCSIAADILARFPSPETFAALMERVRDPDLRFSVVHALRAFPMPEATRALIEHLADPERSVRCTALQGLRERATSEVADAVFRVARDDPEEQVRQVAKETLRTLGSTGKALLVELSAAEERAESEAPAEVLELEMENEALRNPTLS